MPSLSERSQPINRERWNPVKPPAAPIFNPTMPTPLPAHLTQSTVFLSSLPSIATTTDGVTRQFYGTNYPTRRLILPG